MKKVLVIMLTALLPLACAAVLIAAEQRPAIYLEPSDGFETYLAAAMKAKKVPVIVVEQRERAEYILKTTLLYQEPTTLQKIAWRGGITNAAAILLHAQSGKEVWKYDVRKPGNKKKSAAEAIAKHLAGNIARIVTESRSGK